MEKESDKVWYFAFGSNMNPKILSGRRKIYPTKSLPCYLPGWYLNFNTTAIPFLEPSFASVSQKPAFDSQPEVHGVVHEITRSEYDEVRRTEGGGGHIGIGYESVKINITTYDGQTLPAFTLVEYPRTIYHGQFFPSKRYMTLLENGSVEYGLKVEYQEWLKSIPRYEPLPNLRHRIGRTLFLFFAIIFGIPLVLPMVFTHFISRSRGPRMVHYLVKIYKILIGHIYYFLFRPIFGSGAGEPEPQHIKL